MKYTLFFTIITGILLLVTCKQDKETPIQFEINAKPIYFSETANNTSFSITSNVPWKITVQEDDKWCSVSPTTAQGDATVSIDVTANTEYINERKSIIIVSVGNHSEEITVTQAPLPCPEFEAGVVASIGQTLAIGDVPETINSLEDAYSGSGVVSYQWYKNDEAINGATAVTYTPPLSDAMTAGVYSYTRYAKDNACNTTFVPSVGSWVMTVACPDFTAGAITEGSTTCGTNVCPDIIIGNNISAHVNGESSNNITYQWRRSGTSSAILTGSTDTYNISSDANCASPGTYYITRWARYGTCSWIQSSNSYQLVVLETNLPPNAGTQTWVCGTQMWSEALKVPACSYTYTVPSYNIACRNAGNAPPLGTGYLYNAAYVRAYEETICPAPWRIPTSDDFVNLIQYYGGSGVGQLNPTLVNKLVTKWGCSFGGYADEDYTWQDIWDQGVAAYYIVKLTSTYPYNEAHIYADGRVHLSLVSSTRERFLQVRCVRDF